MFILGGWHEYRCHIKRRNFEDQPGTDPAGGLVRSQYPRGVSVGSIYNYFDSKADLVGAVVESVWCEIFHRPEDASVFRDTQACIIWLYGRMEYGSKQYPGFFALHPAGFAGEDPSDGKRRMQQAWQQPEN